jgi:XTP/dITP diphosphohydrolase
MPQLLVATTNRGKIREIRSLLSGLPFDLVTLADFAPLPAPEETGGTFAENARLKALYYGAKTGTLTVAEDSGLEIKALGGEPGVESARLGGADAPNTARFALIYEALRAKQATGSPARFVCALALADRGTIVFEAGGIMEGIIASEPKGSGGFGYDPIFFYPPFGCTLAEAGDVKSTVSHRGQAFRLLHEYLTTEWASRSS